uniref:hypothetical protein n=1 Tax=Streptobacillus moniliformis TaxID=34105 RepID=UPI000A6E637D
NIIKKVKKVDGNKDKLIKLRNKTYVEMGRTTVIILVLKKEAEEVLKFSSIGSYKYNLLKSEKDVNISIWKDSIHFCKVRYNKLKENGYSLIHELIHGETIELELNKGNISRCLVVGFRGGKIEISRVIGDALDLINDKISTRSKERYYITVSTIKSIKKLNKNILGD